MMFDAADLAAFYSPDMPAYATADIGGQVVGVFLRVADRDAWEIARTSTHTLRYLDTTTLAANDLLTIAAVNYKVIGQPKRINGSEFIAELVRQ